MITSSTRKTKVRHIIGCLIVTMLCYTFWNVVKTFETKQKERLVTWLEKKRIVDVARNKTSISLDSALHVAHILESLGALISRQDLKMVDTKKAETIRVSMFAALIAVHIETKQIYDQVKGRVNKTLSLLQPGRTCFDAQQTWAASQTVVLRDLLWTNGGGKPNCVAACEERKLHCVADALYVKTEDELKKIAEAAGFTCDAVFRQPLWAKPWDGPWVLGRQCAFVPHGYWQADCTMKCAFDRICPCSTHPRPAIVQLPNYNPSDSAVMYNLVSPESKELSPFASIEVTLPLNSSLVDRGAGQGGEERTTVGHRSLKLLNRACVVYSFGAGYETRYERRMSSFGCQVHVFDCTMTSDPSKFLDYLAELVPFENVVFHPWCVGKKLETRYKSAYGDALDQFFTFDQIIGKLAHKHVDVVKFDIEGFEWQLLDDLLSSKTLPDQIAFELHTAGAKEGAVPPVLVRHKGQYEVDALFQKLFSLGYHVANKEVNVFDPFCCEFVVVRLCGGLFTQACGTL